MTSDSSDSAVKPIEQLTIAAAPGLFVILWASGFIGAKLGLPYAQTADLSILADARRSSVTRCHRIDRPPQVA